MNKSPSAPTSRLVLLAVVGIASCARPPVKPTLRLEAPLAALLKVQDAAVPLDAMQSELVFWQADGLQLAAKDAAALASLRRYNESVEMVMVSVPTDSDLAAELAVDSRVLGVLPSRATANTYVILPSTNPLLLHAIATAAHAEGSHACGRLERLSLRATALTTEITPPLYAETVRLDEVAALTSQTSAAKIGTTIATLEAMGTRYHDSDSGRAASTKVKELFEAVGSTLPGFSVRLVDHVATTQQSVVVTIAGTEDPTTTVVLGAHLDSIVTGASGDDPAPGADDDASGIATLVDMLRVLAESGARFRRSLELHAYAAEEVGLIGSQEIADSYQDAGRKVASMLQLDMNSYSGDQGKTVYLVTNDTSATLRRSAKDLLNTYLGGDFVEKTLRAGTSDHRSWARAGYPTVFPFEDPEAYNHALHTTDDTSATVNNLPMAARFGALGLAFAAHHAGLVAGQAQYEASEDQTSDELSQDLKVAVLASSDPGAFDVSFATPDTIARVEFCETGAAGSILCTSTRIQTAVDKTAGGRSFFIADQALPLAAGAHLAIFGYDADDKIVAQRTVRLDAK